MCRLSLQKKISVTQLQLTVIALEQTAEAAKIVMLLLVGWLLNNTPSMAPYKALRAENMQIGSSDSFKEP